MLSFALPSTVEWLWKSFSASAKEVLQVEISQKQYVQNLKWFKDNFMVANFEFPKTTQCKLFGTQKMDT